MIFDDFDDFFKEVFARFLFIASVCIQRIYVYICIFMMVTIQHHSADGNHLVTRSCWSTVKKILLLFDRKSVLRYRP